MGLFSKFRGKSDTEDPVCHMKVDPTKAAGSSKHGATSYLFCSTGCKAKFDQNPHQYLGDHSH